MMVLKDVRFAEGTIKVKIKGENKPGSSFVGIAFNISDAKTYEAIYFRPFNFKNQERETHAVQYVSMPDHPWELLRSRFPEKYENKIDPAPDPDSWLDVKIVVKGKLISVFVNEATKPSLEVESLNSNPGEKAIALWVGNNSKGSFKNLSITKSAAAISYGNNPQTGKWFGPGDATLHYEVYGRGEPIVMLQGVILATSATEISCFPPVSANSFPCQTNLPLMPAGKLTEPETPFLPVRLSDTVIAPAGCGTDAFTSLRSPSEGSITTVEKPGLPGTMPQIVAKKS